jgi:DNA (cytosine-5)-methyltransferase 1
MTPRLLDLFCGAGGAAVGYHRAGFEVVGIDSNPQPHYPYEFHQLDAMALVQDRSNGCWHEGVGSCLPGMSSVCLGHFDAIHASPPCQAFTSMRSVAKARGSTKQHPEFVDPIRQKLVGWGGPWVIENVPGAPMRNYVTLCGSMFGLGVRRHRLFETNWLVVAPPHCQHDGHEFVGVYGDHADRINRPHPDGHNRSPKTRDLAEAQAAMGIDWMPWKPLAQAIPPAYTEYLGLQLVEQLKAVA